MEKVKVLTPKGTSILALPDGAGFYFKCNCDERGRTVDSVAAAVQDADDHARRNAWCYVHRDLTPTGDDPVYHECATCEDRRVLYRFEQASDGRMVTTTTPCPECQEADRG